MLPLVGIGLVRMRLTGKRANAEPSRLCFRLLGVDVAPACSCEYVVFDGLSV